MALHVDIEAKNEANKLTGLEVEIVNAIIQNRFDMMIGGATVIQEAKDTKAPLTKFAHDQAKTIEGWARQRFSGLNILVKFEGEIP